MVVRGRSAARSATNSFSPWVNRLLGRAQGTMARLTPHPGHSTRGTIIFNRDTVPV